jgi:RND family efflux transporter MFP subunit
LVLALGASLFVRARASTNKVALDREPKGVSVVTARAADYRPLVRYVGTIEPWVEARLGPQLTSAYVDTVLVRPGARVNRNQVVATLDCRNASAESKTVAMQARALEAQQEAIAHQAARVGGLLGGGFVSPDEAEQKSAESVSKQAELLAAQAKLQRVSLEVSDCILRAPFDGEVAERLMDPGAFARPGAAIVSVIDRRTLRVTADVPESDFAAVAPGSEVQMRLLATGETLAGTIARRSPAADVSTRTLHFEIDVPDPERRIPVNTSAELTIQIGASIPATEIPLIAASVRGKKATLFVVENEVAHKRVVTVDGELAGSLFLDAALTSGSRVVTEGRTLLKDGDRVVARLVEAAQPAPAPAPELPHSRSANAGRPPRGRL